MGSGFKMNHHEVSQICQSSMRTRVHATNHHCLASMEPIKLYPLPVQGSKTQTVQTAQQKKTEHAEEKHLPPIAVASRHPVSIHDWDDNSLLLVWHKADPATASHVLDNFGRVVVVILFCISNI